jgi:HK97 family phage major capsid protein
MRHRAFPGRGPEIEARYQRAGQWLLAAIYHNEKAAAWCASNNVAVTKAAGETVGSNGGFIVPIELSNAILDIRDSYGAARRRARIVPMASDTTSVPRRPGGTGAFFIGEGATAPESNANVDNINLTAKKIGSLIKLSSELEEDAIVDIVDSVANEIAVAFAIKEDDCAINGDGTSAYGKMRGISSIVLDGNHNKAKVAAGTAANTFLTLTSVDLANLTSSIRASAIPNAAWYCSQTCFAQTFCRLAGGTGYLPMAETDGIMTPHYLGFPVILTQKFPLVSSPLIGSVMLAFGDMYAGVALGQRRGITLARSSHRFMDQDQIGVLGTERFHVAVHDMGDNANFGSLAALVGTA